MKKLNVAIIGYGRSGCDIHGSFLRSAQNDICNVVAVVEMDPARGAVAKEHFGCDIYSNYKELLDRKDIDLVINASYSDHHYPISMDLMNHGFNVLSEKPLAKTPEMVQDLIDASKRNNVVFTVFHQYRFNDYFSKMVEILDSKVLGDIKLIKGRQNSFARRYDWQTLLYRDAGSMRNNAAHTIEQMMVLAGSDEMPDIYSRLEIWNSVGDAEDYMFAVLKYKSGLTFEMEVNPSDAYANGLTFEVFGTHGTMRVFPNKIYYKYFLDSEVPAPVLDHKSLHKEDGSPAYCNNHLVWHEEEVELSSDMWNVFGKCSDRYYHALYEHMVNGGDLFIKPEHIKAQIAIFREIERQNPLEVKFERPEGIV